MRRKLIAIPVALLMALGVAAPVGAVTNGVPDGNNHPYVGLLVFDDLIGHPAWRCSGSLISATVVLTAAHCTDGAVAARAWFQPDVTYAVVPFPLYPYGGPGSGAIEGVPHVFPGLRQSIRARARGLLLRRRRGRRAERACADQPGLQLRPASLRRDG